jgi:hypothetical protein
MLSCRLYVAHSLNYTSFSSDGIGHNICSFQSFARGSLLPFFLKVHKNENFFGFDFEFCTISLLVMSKY